MSFLTAASKTSLGLAFVMSCAQFGADASERKYFSNVQGKWSGAGQIVAGPYKNTRFTCKLEGETPTRVGMKLAGSCRVGLFSQPIEAVVTKRGGSYRGKFLDGAKGKGLDIVSGRLRGKKLVLGIKRKKLRGTMVANLEGKNSMNITIAVRVNGGLVPFIGLSLNRKGAARRTSFLVD
ncbi:MAG: hypothetical protein ABJH63_12015 [Rhizobiaceae bacterium]